MRAHQRALVALDTVGRIPLGNDGGDATLLVSGGASREGTVDDVLEGAHGQVVTTLGDHRAHHLINKLGIGIVVLEDEVGGAVELGPCCGDLNLGDLATAVNGSVVHVDNILTLLAVALHDELLHLLDGQVVRNDARNLEEGTLEDGVGAVAQTNLGGDLRGVDDIHINIVEGQILLHIVGKMFLGLFNAPRRVVEERAVLLQAAEAVILAEVARDVDSHEVGRANEVRSQDGLVTETQVRAGVTA